MFFPKGSRKNVWEPHENVSPGPAVTLDGRDSCRAVIHFVGI